MLYGDLPNPILQSNTTFSFLHYCHVTGGPKNYTFPIFSHKYLNINFFCVFSLEKQFQQCEKEAREGSYVHMLSAAKYLLKLSRGSTDTSLNSKKAVQWLIKASAGGVKEATDLLKDCVQQQKGKVCGGHFIFWLRTSIWTCHKGR